MSDTKEAIYAALNKVSSIYRRTDTLSTCAVGIWADNPSNPGVVAVVREGKLYALSIADSYTAMPPQDLEVIINATIINAYLEWSADRARLMQLSNF